MHLLGLSGSLRTASFNTQLVNEAARVFGADTFTLADLNLPLYSGDIEATGIPASVDMLAQQINAADAIVVATPEYNKGLSGVLKNALDWISRTDGKPMAGKPVAMMSATAGRTGGEMAQGQLRLCLAPFGPQLLSGPNVLVANCSKEFQDGRLINDTYQSALAGLMSALRDAAQRQS